MAILTNKKGLERYLHETGRERGLPDIAGTYKGALIICADAACVWDDLERLGCARTGGNANRGRVAGPGDFMTVNRLVQVFPGNLEHAYSNEGHLLQKFIDARRNEYRREFEGPKHTHAINQHAKYRWPWGGWATSGLGAALTGVALGYDNIVLCGMPLDNGPHNGEPPWRKCNFKTEASDTVKGGMNKHWKNAMEMAFEGKVTSMSGRTRDWLGEPRGLW